MKPWEWVVHIITTIIVSFVATVVIALIKISQG